MLFHLTKSATYLAKSLREQGPAFKQCLHSNATQNDAKQTAANLHFSDSSDLKSSTEQEQLGLFSGLDKYCKSPLQNDDFTGTLLLGQNLHKMCNLGTNAKWEPAGFFPLFPA